MKFIEILALILGALGTLLWIGGRLNPPPTPLPSTVLTLTSSAFTNGGVIPSKYTCDSDKTLSPPLTISGAPKGTEMFVLVMDDPDVPKQLRQNGVFDHWVMYGIPPSTRQISEGGTAGNPGLNSADVAAYTGPCPPGDYQPAEHRYRFTLYAVSTTLNFIKVPTKADVLGAIEGTTLAKTTLTGRYARK